MTAFAVAAPASSANLGPGFDCLAMALALENVLEVRPGSGMVTVVGAGAGELSTDADNLVAALFDEASGGALHECDLTCTNRIPLARGLGSSTAAAAVGLVAGWVHAKVAWSSEELFERLARLDGHPDNAAACAFGGLVACTPGGGLPIRLEPPSWLQPVVVIPDRQVATADARAVLPETIPHTRAVAGARAAASLCAALATGADEAVVAPLLQADTLHEQARGRLVPELGEVRSALASTGSTAATLSGAGPTILVWSTPTSRSADLRALEDRLTGCSIVSLPVTTSGAKQIPSPTR